MGSCKELEYMATSGIPNFLPLDFDLIAKDYTEMLINDLQPVYFVADSFERAKQ